MSDFGKEKPLLLSGAPGSEQVSAPAPPTANSLEAALRWSIEARDGSSIQATGPLSDEDKKFLGGALSSLQQNNTAIVKSHVAVVSNEESSEEDILEALEELEDIAEDIDFAVGLVHVNAFPHIIRLANGHVNPEIKSRALNVLANASQNHPALQRHLSHLGCLDVAVPLFNFPSNEVCIHVTCISMAFSSFLDFSNRYR